MVRRGLTVAVIGLGKMGSLHLRALTALRQEGLVDKILCVDLHPRDDLKQLCTEVYACDYRDFRAQNVDLAIIATPTTTHVEAALSLLEQNVNLLVEKPVATSVSDLNKILSEARRRGLRVYAGHIERVNPVVKEIKRILESSTSQCIRAITLRFNKIPAYPERYVNVLWDLLIHDVDLLLYVLKRSHEDVKILQTWCEAEAGLATRVDVLYTIGKTLCFSSAAWTRGDYALRRVTVISEEYAVEADLHNLRLRVHLPERHVETRELTRVDQVYEELRLVLTSLLNEAPCELDLEQVLPSYVILEQIEKGL